jgi:hypothetical protein
MEVGMAELSLTRFDRDGLELFVDESTGLAYAHQAAMRRMFAIDSKGGSLTRALQGVPKSLVKTAEIPTAKGIQGVTLYPSDVVFSLAIKFNPALAEKMGSAGANVFMLGMAGYQIEISPSRPKTALELAREQVQLHEQLELQQRQIELLEADNQRQSEAIDELFEYSSIIRVAKFNGCSEKAFSWSRLKAASQALNEEIKKVPCPRFVTKNLYSHNAWRFAYPGYRLPETTTLVLAKG